MGTGLNEGLGELPPRKILRSRPLDSRKIRKMPMLKLIVFKMLCQGYAKNRIYESRTFFYVMYFSLVHTRSLQLLD